MSAAASVEVPLNVNSADFAAAMNKIVALVKERRRRLSDTHAVSHHHFENRHSIAKTSNGGGASGGAVAATYHHHHRAAKPATPAYTEEALAQIAEIRQRHNGHTHHHHHSRRASSSSASSPAAAAAGSNTGAAIECKHSPKTIGRLPHRSPYAPVLVALAGTAGSGKTTAVKHIVDYLQQIHTAKKKQMDVGEDTDDDSSASGETATSLIKTVSTASTCGPLLKTSTPIKAIAVPLDGYHRYRSELERMPDPALAFTRRGAAFTFNPTLYERDLLTLLDTAAVKFPSFEHHIKDPAEEDIVVDCRGGGAAFSAAQAVLSSCEDERKKLQQREDASSNQRGLLDFGVEVVIVEGLYTLFTGAELRAGDGGANPNPLHANAKPIPFPMDQTEAASWLACTRLFDLKLFVECSLDVTTERLTKRHMAAWSIPREEAYNRASGSDYDNSVVVERTAVNADVVLRSVQL